MSKEENAVNDGKVVTEEVVETTETEGSQPETKVEDTVLASVETEEAPTDEVEEPEADAQPEESSLETKEEEEVPFNKNPKFNERLESIEEKYGKKAQLWDTLTKISTNDPEFGLNLMEKLEAAGELPKGTHQEAKGKLESSKTDIKKPEDTTTELSSLPEVQFAKQLMQDKQQEEQVEQQRIEGLLQDFEKKHTDIDTSKNPRVLRARIATLAEGYRDDGMTYEESLEESYNVLFNRESMIEDAREKGNVEGRIKADLASVATTPSSNRAASTTSVRKLTREEEEARQLLGYSKKDYVKYKDSDGSVE